jgi:transposase-like protein
MNNGFVRLTLAEIRKRVEDEGDAYRLLEDLRWPNGPECPHCGHDRAYFLKPANGLTRATGPKRKMSFRRVWKCAKCRKQFSVLTGTIFHGTKIDISIWLTVMVQMCSAKNGISAREIERQHELTPETAWFMLHRLREAMKREPLADALRGTIVADETWIGGNPTNRHGGSRRHAVKEPEMVPVVPGKNKRTDKTPVLSLINVETGEVRSAVVADVTGHSLRKVIADQMAVSSSVLHTDEAKAYKAIGPEFSEHQSVNHSQAEYVRGAVTTNHAEGYFSQLKRSIDGTHHHVSREHLPRYLAEFDFRYSTCKLADGERLQRMVDQAQGRRLSYKPLRGSR